VPVVAPVPVGYNGLYPVGPDVGISFAFVQMFSGNTIRSDWFDSSNGKSLVFVETLDALSCL